MTLIPVIDHTLVTVLGKEAVLERIRQKTQEVGSEYRISEPLFNGRVKEDGFRISRVIPVAHNALPLIIGKVEETSLGSIIFLKIKLFPAGILFLRTFSLLTALVGMVFLFIPKIYSFATVSFGIGLLNYLLLTFNFHRKTRENLTTLTGLLAADLHLR